MKTDGSDTIAVTGVGVISSIGLNRRQFVESLMQGANGQRPIERFDVSHSSYLSQQGACVPITDDSMDAFEPSKIPFIAVESAKEATDGANLQPENYDPYRLGVAIGTSHGGNHSLMKFLRQKWGLDSNPMDYSLLLLTASTVAGIVARKMGFAGPSVTVSTACSSSTTSVGYAMDLLKMKRVDVMLAGGADLFSELTFSGFNSLRALSRDFCRPLSNSRSGLVLGEGAAMFVLERKSDALRRRAPIYAELLGYSVGNEAHHATAPDSSGGAAYRIMKKAIENSGLSVNDIDYINAHGTATIANDPAELLAIKRLFEGRLDEIYVSSTKSMIGHALGAAGSLELAATILSLNRGFIPPTINFEKPIAGFEDINVVPNRAINKTVRVALSNSFAFAGHCASIVVRTENHQIN